MTRSYTEQLLARPAPRPSRYRFTARRSRRRCARALAAGRSLAETAAVERVAVIELEALLADRQFVRLVEHYAAIAALPRPARLARLADVALEVLELAVEAGELRASMFVLHEHRAGRDPSLTLAEAVLVRIEADQDRTRPLPGAWRAQARAEAQAAAATGWAAADRASDGSAPELEPAAEPACRTVAQSPAETKDAPDQPTGCGRADPDGAPLADAHALGTEGDAHGRAVGGSGSSAVPARAPRCGPWRHCATAHGVALDAEAQAVLDLRAVDALQRRTLATLAERLTGEAERAGTGWAESQRLTDEMVARGVARGAHGRTVPNPLDAILRLERGQRDALFGRPDPTGADPAPASPDPDDAEAVGRAGAGLGAEIGTGMAETVRAESAGDGGIGDTGLAPPAASNRHGAPPVDDGGGRTPERGLRDHAAAPVPSRPRAAEPPADPATHAPPTAAQGDPAGAAPPQPSIAGESQPSSRDRARGGGAPPRPSSSPDGDREWQRFIRDAAKVLARHGRRTRDP